MVSVDRYRHDVGQTPRRATPSAKQRVFRPAQRTSRGMSVTRYEQRRSTARVFLEMKNVVKPWISLQTLGQAEYRVLVSLTRRCQEIERGLGGPVHFPDGLRRVALTVGLILVLSTAICVVAVVAGQWSTAAVLQSGRDGVSRLAYLLRGTNWAQRFGVITVIVVIVAIHCVRTSARDY